MTIAGQFDGSKLLIKLVIGRTLIDTGERGLPYQVEEGGRGWLLAIRNLEAEEAAFILANGDQLNFYHFIREEDGMIRKFWLYDLDRPVIRYDAAERILHVELDTRVAYSNERV